MNLGLIILALCLSKTAGAVADLKDPYDNSDGKIDIIYGPDLLEPYTERRTDWAFSFEISQEDVLPDKFSSFNNPTATATTPQAYSYESLFGKTPIRMIQLGLGAKYNITIGALNLDALVGYGEVSDGRSGETRSLSLLKRGLRIGYTMDSLFKEPYVAPYVMGQVFEMDYVDKGSAAGDSKGTTAPTTGATIGLLLQLNHVDPSNSAFIANRDFGLNNTFLDVFMTQYNTSTSTDDPSFESSMNFGAGLKLEF